MTLPPSIAHEDFVKYAKKILQDRIKANNPSLTYDERNKIDNELGNPPLVNFQKLLTDTGAPVGLSAKEAPTCCLYVVDGNEFCVCQVSASECSTLQGQVVNPCPDPPGQIGYNL
jgi:hypothetical protein